MKKIKSKTFLLIMTGGLIGLAPLITDAYLPAFPQLMDSFQTTPSMIQMSLMSAMLGIAIGPLFIGPLSDRHGRLLPLLLSLTAFCVVTFICIFITNLSLFILLRFIQGATAATGMVLSRAIITDSFTGHELTRAHSINTAIFGFMPSTAPIFGGIFLVLAQWQGIFMFLLAVGIIMLLFSLRLEESLPKEKRQKLTGGTPQNSYLKLWKNKDFLKYIAIFSFSFAIVFAYMAASPFILQTHYTLTPMMYSFAHALCTLASALGSVWISRFDDPNKALRTGTLGAVILMTISAVLLLLHAPIILFLASIFILYIFNGLTFPASTMLALGTAPEHAGTASALLGSVSFLLGGIISPLVGLGNVVYGASIAMLACAVISMLLCYLGFKKTGTVTSTPPLTAGPPPQNLMLEKDLTH